MTASRFSETLCKLMLLSHDILACFRGWKKLEEKKSRFHGLWVVIDDLADTKVEPRAFSSQDAVDADLTRLLERARTSAEPYRDLTIRRLQQSQGYLRQKPGARATREDVLARGLRWEVVTDEELATLRRAYLDLRKELLDSGVTTEPSLADYQKEGPGSMAVARAIKAVGMAGLDAMRKTWSWLPALQCEVETERSDGAWRNMVTTGERGLKLILNEGPNATFSPALTEFLGLHEIAGHMGHFSFMRTRKDLQEQSPHLLQLTIHGQDAYYAEGVGQWLSEVACEAAYGPKSLQNLELRRVDFMLALRNQNIMAIIEGQRTLDDAVKVHHDALGGDLKVLQGQYTAYTSDPFFCCQVLVFYPSLKALKPALALPAEEKAAFAKELLSLGRGPVELDELVGRFR